MLFTEHDMDVVFAHADRILVLVRGEIIAAGRPTRCAPTRRCAQVYLGDRGRRRDRARGARMAERILEVEGLDAAYGRAQILFDVVAATWRAARSWR